MPGPEDDAVEGIVEGIVEDDTAEERALQLAVLLSMRQHASAMAITIADSDDDDNDDGPSTASSENATQQTTQMQSQAHSQPVPSSSQQSQFGSVMLDRRAMEQERLKRLEKRQRSAADNDDDDVVEVPPPKKQATGATTAPVEGNIKTLGASASASTSASTSVSASTTRTGHSSVPFANPTVKRTWARGTPRRGDEITIEEVFQKDQLELAVLSSFQWDEEWMLSKLDYKRTKIMLLAFARDEAQKTLMQSNVPANIRFCFPPMHGVGAMHSKLQLLKYPGHLRIVIPTGNLVPYDWGETGVMENMVFLIDLPRLEDYAVSTLANAARSHAPTRFYTELVYFLQATGVGEKMVASLANYDFSRTADIALVYTIPGSHSAKSAERVGYVGLATSVADLGLATSDPVDVDLVCASLGSLNQQLVRAIYNACRGDDGIASTSSRPSAKQSTTTVTSQEQLLRERFRIYFPTDRTVSASRGGRNAGGTICVQAKWWRSASFPRELVRDVISRDRLLMHSKMIFVRRRAGDAGQSPRQSAGWAYVGSANLSESAWGRMSRERSTGAMKLTCRNWECGVIIPVPESQSPAVDKTAPSADDDMSLFAGTVPVPMQVPGPVYGSSDQPWLYLGA
ncbi:tyrosyl-DNA phosphodiesterase domain-containing protein [Trichoderma austrokoningii]